MDNSYQHPFKVDIHTFDKLFIEHYPALRAYAALLIDDDSAEDIVQDVFLLTWEKRDAIIIHTSIKAYLFKAVYNRCLNKLEHLKMVHNKHLLIEHKFSATHGSCRWMCRTSPTGKMLLSTKPMPSIMASCTMHRQTTPE